MNWKELNKKAVKLIIAGKVRKIMDSVNFGEQYEVGDDDEYYTVSIVTKSGRNLVSCTCKNGTRFVNESPICTHKIAVIMFCQRSLFK